MLEQQFVLFKQRNFHRRTSFTEKISDSRVRQACICWSHRWCHEPDTQLDTGYPDPRERVWNTFL